MLELVGLSKRYGEVTALRDLSFSVDSGSIYGFVGPNGAGKTTAMRIVLGVLAADSGEVLWRGQPIDRATRRRIGYMPEERGLYPKMRIHDQLVYLARLHGIDRSAADANVSRWLERMGLAERRDDTLEALSLGNQQRVQLAAALVHEPELLVLDEPFSGLDPVGVEVLATALQAESRERELPVIFSSHQLDLVERLCDGVAIINHGTLIAHGTLDELRSSRAENRFRAEVEGETGEWWSGLDGVERVGDASFRLAPGADPQALLDRARAAGPVRRFGPETPTLSELFRDAISAPADEAKEPAA